MIKKILFILQYHLARSKSAKRRRSLIRQIMLMRKKMQIRTRNTIGKESLIPHEMCEWHHLLRFGSNNSFICATSLTKEGFLTLLATFKDYYSNKSGPGKKGRPSSVKASTALGLLLTFYRSSSEFMILSRMFGLSPSSICRVIEKSETALQQTLAHIPDAQIRWPTLEEQEIFAQAVNRRHAYVLGRWGFVDGKNYSVQTPSNTDLQNAMYNGWLHCTFITGVFCFAADGTVAWGKHNIVGSWNDGEVSRNFQEKILRDDINLPDYGVVADTAFPVGRGLENRIQTPLKDGDLERIPYERRREAQIRSDAITSMRQSAEWGMGAVEKVYRRLELKLPWNQKVRGRRLVNIYRLYNFRVRNTDISQIRSYFF